MKKLLASLLALTMAFTLSGCGAAGAQANISEAKKELTSDKDEQAAIETVENFYDAIQNGNLDELQDYCTDDFNEDSNVEDLANQMNDLYDQLNGLGLGDSINQSFDDMMDTLWHNLVRDYKVTDVTKKNDKIRVTVKVKGIDENDLEDIDVDAIVNQLMDKYAAEIEAATTEEQQNEVLTKMIQELLTEMSNRVEEMDSVTSKVRFTLVKEGSDWLIDKETNVD